MQQSLSTEASQPLNSKQSNKSSAARTSKHLNAETILKTDTPRTRELKTLRAKRLAYFVGPSHNNTNTSAAVSSLETNDKQGSFDHEMSHPLRENLVNAEQKDPLTVKTLDCNESVQHTRIQDAQKAHCTDLEPSLTISKSDKATACLPKPDYNLLQNPTVSEIQKLRHILNWAQKILQNSEEVMNTRAEKACAINEKELIVSHVNSDTEQPDTSNCSLVTGRSIHTGPSNVRLDGSRYSADIYSSSDSCSSLDLLRTSRALVQTSSLATSLSEEQEQCKLTDTDYPSKDYFFPNNIWKRSFSEQANAYRDNVLSDNWKIKSAEESKMHVAQFEFPADKNYHPVLGDMSAPNRDKYFWIPLEGSSDEDDVAGNGERKEAFMEPTISARTVILRKCPETDCYTSDQLASPINLHKTTQHSLPTHCDEEKHNYVPLEAKEYLSGGYHKTSAEDTEAAGKPDVLLNLEDARFSFKSQMDLSFIPSLDLSTPCRGTIVSPNEATAANEKNEGTKLVSSFQERPSSEPFPERSGNVNLTNISKTLLSHSSVSPKCYRGKILDKRGTENVLALESGPLKKEANHNNDQNETSQQIIDYKAHSMLKLSSSSLLSFSDSSYSTRSNPQFKEEQSNVRERGQITDESIDSFLPASNLVKFCPKCCGNSSTGNWCMECGCVLIGITPQFVTASSNVDKISSLNPRGSPKQKKPNVLPTNAIAASEEHSDFMESDMLYGLEYSKVNRCVSSGTCDLQLSTYEKYLIFMEHLQKIRSQHQTKEQQPADVILLKDNTSQTEVVDESNNYCGKQEMEKNNIASFKPSICFSDYTNRKQIDCEQDSEDNPMRKPDIGAISSEEICIIPEVSVVQCVPQEKDFQQKNYVETAKNIMQRVFWEQIFENQKEDQSLTSTECESKKIMLKDADIRPRRRKSIQSSLNQYQRCWENSSTAWSSYTYGAIKPRSTNTIRPQTADDCWKSRKKPLLHDGPSAGMSLQFRENVIGSSSFVPPRTKGGPFYWRPEKLVGT
ncbi:uncharacterized protein LOC144691336 [Cetorhinus maximus]